MPAVPVIPFFTLLHMLTLILQVKTDMVVNLQAEAFAPLDAWEARYLDAYVSCTGWQ
jgi:hypothetical protein